MPTPAVRSGSPGTHKRRCGTQPADQSMITDVLQPRLLPYAASLLPPSNAGDVARQNALTADIRASEDQRWICPIFGRKPTPRTIAVRRCIPCLPTRWTSRPPQRFCRRPHASASTSGRSVSSSRCTTSGRCHGRSRRRQQRIGRQTSSAPLPHGGPGRVFPARAGMNCSRPPPDPGRRSIDQHRAAPAKGQCARPRRARPARRGGRRAWSSWRRRGPPSAAHVPAGRRSPGRR